MVEGVKGSVSDLTANLEAGIAGVTDTAPEAPSVTVPKPKKKIFGSMFKKSSQSDVKVCQPSTCSPYAPSPDIPIDQFSKNELSATNGQGGRVQATLANQSAVFE